jgi:PleD family two-component response regulator
MLNASVGYSVIGYLVRKLNKANISLINLNNQLNQLSILDGLTSIFNRRYFDIELANEWRKSFHNQQPLALMMLCPLKPLM